MAGKKALQEQRVRGYFIAATKEILQSEGLKSVSVRNIADRAGYSFASLYNYFKDAKDLVFLCVHDFRAECIAYAQEHSQKQVPGTKHLKAVTMAYMEYFIQYPGIFELFFNEKLSDISGSGDTTQLVTSLLEELTNADWQLMISQGLIPAREVAFRKESMLAGTTGLLLLYLNRRYPTSYDDFLHKAKHFIDQQLKPI
ncbi:TetR/AcrR family transcriptional regulator [Chitinophaga sp. Cy-1792]|uniref:TetR/AcrR family transcriptional regulator n=1 Tax=Chitinophaga sp. Cy-1792 TaxID=2608339 RepID=UPI001421B3ED|nr:TetR/AcrR family transcriptional regulator [Chitinophaga sp. Cy-1792]NIG55675.1 TetR/AcrR family transcriptional regulator [Chitinophaga sp. Cy-1792]